MTETIIPIPARLRSSVVGGHVTGAVDILDDSKNMDQAAINAAVDATIGDDETEGTVKGRIKALEESVGPGGSVEEQINAKVATLDATVSQTAGTDGLALQVTEVDGKLTGVTGSIAANTYDAHGAAATAKSELLGDAASDYNTLGKLEDKIQAEATARGNEDTALDGRLDTIEGLIPSQATTTNQLADKSFVNSSISTATATFRGSKNLVSDLSLPVDATESQIATALATAISTADNNDYAFVQVPTSATTPTQIARVDRYKYNGTAWAFEYSINNSGYTAEQWAAINSGITSNLVTAFGAKYDLPSGGMPSTDMSSAVQTSLGKADTAYQKPSAGIPDTDLTSGVQSSLGKADTAYQKPSGGIPSTDMDSSVQSSLSAADSAYQLPSGGVPKTDLASGVQSSLDAADSAYQLPSGGIPDTDLSSAVQTSLGKADTALQNVPTASASVLGGVKVGTNLSIDANGVLSATDTTYSDFVGSGSSHAHGLVPDPGATAGTTKYLREDGSWQTPPGQNYSAGDGLGLSNGEFSVDSSVARLAEGESGVLLPEFVPGIFTGTCSTAAATQAKEVEITGYELIRHNGVAVTFTNGISVASATLNISSLGAKPLYYKGAALAADVILAGDIATMTYNGTQFEIFSIERKPVYSQIGSTNYYSMTI